MQFHVFLDYPGSTEQLGGSNPGPYFRLLVIPRQLGRDLVMNDFNGHSPF